MAASAVGMVIVLACLAAIALGVAAPAQAHHYYAAAFDASNPTTLKGVVTKIAWWLQGVLVHVHQPPAQLGDGTGQ